MESDHFKDHELACPCCGVNKTTQKLRDGLEELRRRIDRIVILNSAYRCERHNKEVGGAPNSYHMKGMAADTRTFGMTPEELAMHAMDIFGGVIIYPSFVHLDTREIRYFSRRN